MSQLETRPALPLQQCGASLPFAIPLGVQHHYVGDASAAIARTVDGLLAQFGEPLRDLKPEVARQRRKEAAGRAILLLLPTGSIGQMVGRALASIDDTRKTLDRNLAAFFDGWPQPRLARAQMLAADVSANVLDEKAREAFVNALHAGDRDAVEAALLLPIYGDSGVGQLRRIAERQAIRFLPNGEAVQNGVELAETLREILTLHDYSARKGVADMAGSDAQPDVRDVRAIDPHELMALGHVTEPLTLRAEKFGLLPTVRVPLPLGGTTTIKPAAGGGLGNALDLMALGDKGAA